MFINRKREVDPNQNPELEEKQNIERRQQLEMLGMLDQSIFEKK